MESKNPDIKKKVSEKEEVNLKSLSIKRVNPDNLRSVFANDFMISRSTNEYFLTFSILEPPQVFTATDLNDVDVVSAIAVSKIAVTPAFAKAVLDVLTRNLSDNEEDSVSNEKASEG